MKSILTDSLAQIRERGYRVTPQRQLILAAIVDHGGHVTAAEVYDIVRQQIPAINQTTVYRVLDFFCEMNLVTKADIGGRSVYEALGDRPHHHLICRGCNNVEVLEDHHFEALMAHLYAEHHFKAELSHLTISGLCFHCLAAEEA